MRCLPCALMGREAHKCQRFIYAGAETLRCGHGCTPGPYLTRGAECLLSVHDVPAGGAIPCTCGGKRPKDDDPGDSVEGE